MIQLQNKKTKYLFLRNTPVFIEPRCKRYDLFFNLRRYSLQTSTRYDGKRGRVGVGLFRDLGL